MIFEFWAIHFRAMIKFMDEPDQTPPRYKWPWFVLAASILFIALAVVFVGLKARQIKQERDFGAPTPGGPAH